MSDCPSLASAPRHRAGLDRRTVLGLGAAGAACLALPLASPARAQASPHSFKVGEAEVIVLSDGTIDLPVSLVMPGREPAAIEAAFKAAGATFSGFNSQVSPVVIRLGKETILVDAGAGPDFMPSLGKLADRMQAAGLAPETITKVVFTHAHPDHLWGVIDSLTGDTMFERAEHVMTAPERDFWMQTDVDTRVGAAFKGMAAGTHRRLKTIAARVKAVALDHEVVPGLQLVDTRGHTPGHASVMLRSGGSQLLVGGDVLTQNIISFQQPDWKWGPDMDGDVAIASRRRILDRLASEKTPLLGYHLPWPGVGRVERAGTAYRLVQS